jgi:hypothetical protein
MIKLYDDYIFVRRQVMEIVVISKYYISLIVLNLIVR